MKKGTRTVLALALSASLAQGSFGNLYAFAAEGDPIEDQLPAGTDEGQDTPQNGVDNNTDAVNVFQPRRTSGVGGGTTLGDSLDDTAGVTLGTITYDANGGTCEIASETVVADTEGKCTVILPSVDQTVRSGYQLDGWMIDGTKYEPGTSLTFTGDITATASWKWAQGSIQLDFGWVSPDKYRNDLQANSGGSLGWLLLPYYSTGSAELIDAKGNVVESYTNEARHTFSNLPEGVYTIHVTLDPKVYFVVESIVNGGPIDHLMKSFEAQIEIKEDDRSTHSQMRWIAVEYRAFGLATETQIGSFASTDSNSKTYYRNTNNNFSFANTDASTVAKNPTFNSHAGIYWGDSANQYSGMNALEVPTLSQEELAKGYQFAGWRVKGDSSGAILTEAEALAHKIYDHTVFEAVWTYPTHTVTFKTNSDYGNIGGKSSYSFKSDFDNTLLGSKTPAVTAEDGYEFIGWYNDLTTNVIPEDELAQIQVNKDLTFYAKFKKIEKGSEAVENYAVTYLPGDNGTLSGTNELMLPAGSFIPTIPTVTPETGYEFTGKWEVVAVGADSPIAVGDVMNEVQISRLQLKSDLNLKALYEIEKPAPKDGKDGVDGKDGKDGADGKDGRDGVDGKDGRDGVDGKDATDATEEPKDDEKPADDQGLIVEDVETPKDDQPKDDGKKEPETPADEAPSADDAVVAPTPTVTPGVVSGTVVTGSTGTSGVARSGVVSGTVTPSTMSGSTGTVVSSTSGSIPKMGDENKSLFMTAVMGVMALAAAGFAALTRRKAEEQ